MKTKRRLFIVITPLIVANNFLTRGKKEKIEITPLKLQKLVYFLYATFLKSTGLRLFNEPFETWINGPVLPSIYAYFRAYGEKPIKTLAKDSLGDTYTVTETGDFKDTIDLVWNELKDKSGDDLSKLTHEPNTAWSKADKVSSWCLDDENIKGDGLE